MSSTPTDAARKYEVVSTIGKGSFGVIRKVRRDDGLVRLLSDSGFECASSKVRLADDVTDSLPQRNFIHQDVCQRARTAAFGVLNPVNTSSSEHSILLSSGAP